MSRILPLGEIEEDVVLPDDEDYPNEEDEEPQALSYVGSDGVEFTAARSASVPKHCPIGLLSTYRTLSDRRKVQTPVKYLHTKGKLKATYAYDRTKETSLGVVTEVAGKKASGGLSGSKTNESGLGWVAAVGNYKHRMFAVEWQYAKQQLQCRYPSSSSFPVKTATYRWIPWKPTGGSSYPFTSYVSPCPAGWRINVAASTTMSKNTTAGFSGFFEVVGIKLNASQKTTMNQVLKLESNDPMSPATVCGSNDFPPYATFVREH